MKIKNNICLYVALIAFSTHCKPVIDFSDSQLDAIAVKHGTDKASHWNLKHRNPHNYARIYDFYFSHLRNEPIKFLEIGFLEGESAATWDEYFTRAELHFMDIRPEYFEKYGKNLSSRCHLHVGNQEKRNVLLNFLAKVGGDFDIILDDGGHTMKQQLVSFNVLFPAVKSGGVYIIEDLHTSYWKRFGSEGTLENPAANEHSTIHFLQQLIHEVNYIGARTGSASAEHCPREIFDNLSYYQQHIESMHFYGSLCFIFKK